MPRLSRLLPGGLALAVALAGCLTNTTTSSGPGAGASATSQQGASEKALPDLGAAPAIAGTDQDGNKMQLSDFRGKVVLLDFWSTS